jgi:restriction system protein
MYKRRKTTGRARKFLFTAQEQMRPNRLCVEVKSGSTPTDRPTVDKLLGAVTKFGATEGLFVSQRGFKPNVQKELAASFFLVRLWSKKELLEQLFLKYEKLDEDLEDELPLNRILTVTPQGH